MAKRQAKQLDTTQMSFDDYELKEVTVRLVLNETSSLYSTTPLRTPEDAVKVMGELLRGSDREMVCVINVDNKLRPISHNFTYSVVAIGGISSSMVPVANCFKAALLSNAAAVVLLHSHPSGDARPSAPEDFDVTKRFVQAGKLLDIPALDHIIVGAYQGEMFSFRENYPDMFYAEPDLSVFPEIDTSKGWHVAEHDDLYLTGEHGRADRGKGISAHDRKIEKKASVLGRLEGKKAVVSENRRLAGQKKLSKKQEYSLE